MEMPNSSFIEKNLKPRDVYFPIESETPVEDLDTNKQLKDINIFYSTEKLEEFRSTFDETFTEKSAIQSEQGKKFLLGLTENKENLCKELGLTSEQYDSLSCIAMGLASQETGFGEEKGYIAENTGMGKLIRGFLKYIDVKRGGKSASSGLTQMKIYDFMQDENLKPILEKFGISAEGYSTNNLYKNPDKSAIATIIVLNSLNQNYDTYKNELEKQHQLIADEYKNNSAELSELENKGNEILNNFLNVYKNLSDDKKIELRETIKDCMLSQNGTKKTDKGVEEQYNEELQMEKLNNLLKENGADFQMDESSLQSIRYALTTEGQEMNNAEYCAYAWNKGTEETGMQLDRMLAEKIGTILSDPEDFDYNQFTSNVSKLADKYAEQIVDGDGLTFINQSLGEIIG